ncbi:MAG: hypothetical protein JRC93_13895, partial [Deltaproteobacteria bacterium]|nr:hypothetical protein [Deltaproteobacteria bacterium]
MAKIIPLGVKSSVPGGVTTVYRGASLKAFKAQTEKECFGMTKADATGAGICIQCQEEA